MALYNDLVVALPELEGSDHFRDGTIILQNDADDAGDYIAKWDYTKPIPAGFKLGK
jgi:hypothetical protein